MEQIISVSSPFILFARSPNQQLLSFLKSTQSRSERKNSSRIILSAVVSTCCIYFLSAFFDLVKQCFLCENSLVSRKVLCAELKFHLLKLQIFCAEIAKQNNLILEKENIKCKQPERNIAKLNH